MNFQLMKKRILMPLILTVLATTVLPQSLDEQVEEAEKRAKLAEARKKERDALLSVIPDVSSIKAGTSVEGNGIETHIRGYDAVNGLAEQIAQKIRSRREIGGLLVFRDAEYVSVMNYLRIMEQLRWLEARYLACPRVETSNKHGTEKPGLKFFGTNGVAIASAILPLFKSDIQLRSSQFDADDEAFWATLSDLLRKRRVGPLDSPNGRPVPLYNVFTSALLSQDLTGGQAGSSLLTRLENIQNLNQYDRSCVEKDGLDGTLVSLAAELGIPFTDRRTRAIHLPLGKTAKPGTENSLLLGEAQPEKPVTKTEVKTPIVDWLRIERLVQAMKDKKLYWIKFKTLKAGGTMRVKSTPIVDIFRGGNRVRFSGGRRGITTYSTTTAQLLSRRMCMAIPHTQRQIG